MYSEALPRPLDFFPHTRRGHGSTHPAARFDKDGVQTRAGNPCVSESCSLNRRQDGGKAVKGELHDDQKANVEEWKEAHGFNLDTPLEECTSRELAR